MPYLNHHNIEFHYLDRGAGLPVIFQHGLGGATEKVFDQVSVPIGFRLLGLDCRGHGGTKPLGDPTRLGFNTFADDVLEMLDHLQIPRAIIGGTSMGAGVALNFTLRYPQRVAGLILLRPAWLDAPNKANVLLFAELARVMREHGPVKGLDIFKQTGLYSSIARESSDCAASLLALFLDPNAFETVARLERIPRDAPNHDRAEWRRIAVPTLVLANRQDPIHPFDYGRVFAETIPAARFQELTPKSISVAQYLADLRTSLAGFLQDNFPDGKMLAKAITIRG
jgi:pimeloyl-ACP methyl ester carboxylesterase